MKIFLLAAFVVVELWSSVCDKYGDATTLPSGESPQLPGPRPEPRYVQKSGTNPKLGQRTLSQVVTDPNRMVDVVRQEYPLISEVAPVKSAPELNQALNLNAQFHQRIEEGEEHFSGLVIKFAHQNNPTEMRRAATAVLALEFLGLFDLEQRDGKSVLTIMQASTADSRNETGSDLIHQTGQQIRYFESLPGYDHRAKNFVLGDPVSNQYFAIFKYILDQLTNWPFIVNSPEQIHHENTKIVNEVLEKARKNPRKYGDSAPYENITDIDFPYLADAIAKQQAWWAGFLGGITSTLVKNWLGKILFSGVAEFVTGNLSTITIEAVFTGTGCYLGLKRIYALHSYYSYMLSEKFIYEQELKRPFDFKKAAMSYEASLPRNDEVFDRQIVVAWLWGFLGSQAGFRGATYATDWLATNLATNVLGISVQGGLKGLLEKTVENQTLYQLMERLPTFVKAAVHIFPPSGVALDLLKNLSPAGIVYFLTDFSAKGLVMYWVIYWRIVVSSWVLQGVFHDPGTNIQLALFRARENPDFAEASRTVFYPICLRLARHREPQWSRYYEAIEQQRRIRVCSRLMATFEEKDQGIWPGSYLKLASDQYYYDSAVAVARDYPRYFVVVWMAALRAIYPMSEIPAEYWDVRCEMVIANCKPGVLGYVNSTLQSASPDPTTASTLLNLNRLSYAVDWLTVEDYKRKTQTNPEEKTFPRDLIPDDAFVTYFNHHRMLTLHNEIVLKEIIDELNQEGWNGAIKSFGRHLKQTNGVSGMLFTSEVKKDIQGQITSLLDFQSEQSQGPPHRSQSN